MAYDPDTAMGGPRADFPTTRESAVSDGAAGLAAIAAAYWKPTYRYVRIRWRKSSDEAKDLTQGFFASLLERGLTAKFDSGRGRFRTYLRTCIDGYVANANTAAARDKRGGRAIHEAIDGDTGGRTLAASSPATPEEIFLREWQRSLFAEAVDALRAECAGRDRAVYWRVFEAYDLAASAERPSYADLATRHAIPESSVINYLRWCRQRLRTLVADRVERSTPPGFDARAESRDAFR